MTGIIFQESTHGGGNGNGNNNGDGNGGGPGGGDGNGTVDINKEILQQLRRCCKEINGRLGEIAELLRKKK